LSSAPEIAGGKGLDTASSGAALSQKTNMEWPARALFGGLLAVLAVASTLGGGFYLAGFVGLIAVAGAREWHRMVGSQFYLRETVLTGCAIVAALVCMVLAPQPLWPVLILASGGLAAAASSYSSGALAAWNGAGALYLGASAVSIVALRTYVPFGVWTVIGVFIVIWTADTGALLAGRLFGGPKLIPSLSPNKTWAGFAGGTVAPAAASALYVWLLHGNAWKAALLGAALALAGHAGDLFESWVKRRVGRKNSGSLIPGHGGVLDRIDSSLFVAPVAAALVFVFGLDPLFGGHP
jgi:phosphatidate cytidylyltransferase